MSKNMNDEKVKVSEGQTKPVQLMLSGLALVFVAIVVWGVFYITQMDKIAGKPIDLNYIDTGYVWVDIADARSTEIPGVNPELILKPTAELIAKGKELFTTTCTSCHGENGDGNGPASGPLNPKPRNFKQADNWTNGKKFSDMYKTLQEGIASRGMAAYEYIAPADRIAIIQYIRATFGGFPEVAEADVTTLETNYSLSKGMKTANNLSVVKSLAILSKEAEAKNAIIDAKAEIITKNASENTNLAAKIISNPKKAVSFCLNDANVLANKESFVKLVSSSINQNGFNAKFLILNNTEMSELYSFLNGLVK